MTMKTNSAKNNANTRDHVFWRSGAVYLECALENESCLLISVFMGTGELWMRHDI